MTDRLENLDHVRHELGLHPLTAGLGGALAGFIHDVVDNGNFREFMWLRDRKGRFADYLGMWGPEKFEGGKSAREAGTVDETAFVDIIDPDTGKAAAVGRVVGATERLTRGKDGKPAAAYLVELGRNDDDLGYNPEPIPTVKKIREGKDGKPETFWLYGDDGTNAVSGDGQSIAPISDDIDTLTPGKENTRYALVPADLIESRFTGSDRDTTDDIAPEKRADLDEAKNAGTGATGDPDMESQGIDDLTRPTTPEAQDNSDTPATITEKTRKRLAKQTWAAGKLDLDTPQGATLIADLIGRDAKTNPDADPDQVGAAARHALDMGATGGWSSTEKGHKSEGVFFLNHPDIGTITLADDDGSIKEALAGTEYEDKEWDAPWSGVRRQDYADDIIESHVMRTPLAKEVAKATQPGNNWSRDPLPDMAEKDKRTRESIRSDAELRRAERALEDFQRRKEAEEIEFIRRATSGMTEKQRQKWIDRYQKEKAKAKEEERKRQQKEKEREEKQKLRDKIADADAARKQEKESAKEKERAEKEAAKEKIRQALARIPIAVPAKSEKKQGTEKRSTQEAAADSSGSPLKTGGFTADDILNDTVRLKWRKRAFDARASHDPEYIYDRGDDPKAIFILDSIGYTGRPTSMTRADYEAYEGYQFPTKDGERSDKLVSVSTNSPLARPSEVAVKNSQTTTSFSRSEMPTVPRGDVGQNFLVSENTTGAVHDALMRDVDDPKNGLSLNLGKLSKDAKVIPFSELQFNWDYPAGKQQRAAKAIAGDDMHLYAALLGYDAVDHKGKGVRVLNRSAMVTDGLPDPADLESQGGDDLMRRPSDKPRHPKSPNPPWAQGEVADMAEDANGDWGAFLDALSKRTVVAFDYETTGLDPKMDGPVQLGAVKTHNGEIVDRFNTYINPGQPLGEWSKNNLKNADGDPLTDEWLAQQPTIEQAHREFMDFLSDTPDGGEALLASHNYVFDGGFLEESLNKSGIDYVPAGSIDTLALSRAMKDQAGGDWEDNKLPTLAEYYNVDLEDWHSASADAEAAAKVFTALAGDARANRGLLDPEVQESLYDDAVDAYGKEMDQYKKAMAEWEQGKQQGKQSDPDMQQGWSVDDTLDRPRKKSPREELMEVDSRLKDAPRRIKEAQKADKFLGVKPGEGRSQETQVRKEVADLEQRKRVLEDEIRATAPKDGGKPQEEVDDIDRRLAEIDKSIEALRKAIDSELRTALMYNGGPMRTLGLQRVEEMQHQLWLRQSERDALQSRRRSVRAWGVDPERKGRRKALARKDRSGKLHNERLKQSRRIRDFFAPRERSLEDRYQSIRSRLAPQVDSPESLQTRRRQFEAAIGDAKRQIDRITYGGRKEPEDRETVERLKELRDFVTRHQLGLQALESIATERGYAPVGDFNLPLSDKYPTLPWGAEYEDIVSPAQPGGGWGDPAQPGGDPFPAPQSSWGDPDMQQGWSLDDTLDRAPQERNPREELMEVDSRLKDAPRRIKEAQKADKFLGVKPGEGRSQETQVRKEVADLEQRKRVLEERVRATAPMGEGKPQGAVDDIDRRLGELDKSITGLKKEIRSAEVSARESTGYEAITARARLADLQQSLWQQEKERSDLVERRRNTKEWGVDPERKVRRDSLAEKDRSGKLRNERLKQSRRIRDFFAPRERGLEDRYQEKRSRLVFEVDSPESLQTRRRQFEAALDSAKKEIDRITYGGRKEPEGGEDAKRLKELRDSATDSQLGLQALESIATERGYAPVGDFNLPLSDSYPTLPWGAEYESQDKYYDTPAQSGGWGDPAGGWGDPDMQQAGWGDEEIPEISAPVIPAPDAAPGSWADAGRDPWAGLPPEDAQGEKGRALLNGARGVFSKARRGREARKEQRRRVKAIKGTFFEIISNEIAHGGDARRDIREKLDAGADLGEMMEQSDADILDLENALLEVVAEPPPAGADTEAFDMAIKSARDELIKAKQYRGFLEMYALMEGVHPAQARKDSEPDDEVSDLDDSEPKAPDSTPRGGLRPPPGEQDIPEGGRRLPDGYYDGDDAGNGSEGVTGIKKELSRVGDAIYRIEQADRLTRADRDMLDQLYAQQTKLRRQLADAMRAEEESAGDGEPAAPEPSAKPKPTPRPKPGGGQGGATPAPKEELGKANSLYNDAELTAAWQTLPNEEKREIARTTTNDRVKKIIMSDPKLSRGVAIRLAENTSVTGRDLYDFVVNTVGARKNFSGVWTAAMRRRKSGGVPQALIDAAMHHPDPVVHEAAAKAGGNIRSKTPEGSYGKGGTPAGDMERAGGPPLNRSGERQVHSTRNIPFNTTGKSYRPDTYHLTHKTAWTNGLPPADPPDPDSMSYAGDRADEARTLLERAITADGGAPGDAAPPSTEMRQALDATTTAGEHVRSVVDSRVQQRLADMGLPGIDDLRQKIYTLNQPDKHGNIGSDAAHNKAVAQYRRALQVRREEVIRALNENNSGIGTGKARLTGQGANDKVRAIIEQSFPAAWLDRLPEVTIKIDPNIVRPAANQSEMRISLPPKMLEGSDHLLQVAVVHEMTHLMQANIPGMHQLEQALLWKRAGGPDGQLGDAVDYYGSSRQNRPDVVIPDNFPSPYTGRRYEGPGGTSSGEIMTTLFEEILGGGDVPYVDGDEELYNFALGSLFSLNGQGTLQKPSKWVDRPDSPGGSADMSAQITSDPGQMSTRTRAVPNRAAIQSFREQVRTAPAGSGKEPKEGNFFAPRPQVGEREVADPLTGALTELPLTEAEQESIKGFVEKARASTTVSSVGRHRVEVTGNGDAEQYNTITADVLENIPDHLLPPDGLDIVWHDDESWQRVAPLLADPLGHGGGVIRPTTLPLSPRKGEVHLRQSGPAGDIPGAMPALADAPTPLHYALAHQIGHIVDSVTGIDLRGLNDGVVGADDEYDQMRRSMHRIHMEESRKAGSGLGSDSTKSADESPAEMFAQWVLGSTTDDFTKGYAQTSGWRSSVDYSLFGPVNLYPVGPHYEAELRHAALRRDDAMGRAAALDLIDPLELGGGEVDLQSQEIGDLRSPARTSLLDLKQRIQKAHERGLWVTDAENPTRQTTPEVDRLIDIYRDFVREEMPDDPVIKEALNERAYDYSWYSEKIPVDPKRPVSYEFNTDDPMPEERDRRAMVRWLLGLPADAPQQQVNDARDGITDRHAALALAEVANPALGQRIAEIDKELASIAEALGKGGDSALLKEQEKALLDERDKRRQGAVNLLDGGMTSTQLTRVTKAALDAMAGWNGDPIAAANWAKVVQVFPKKLADWLQVTGPLGAVGIEQAPKSRGAEDWAISRVAQLTQGGKGLPGGEIQKITDTINAWDLIPEETRKAQNPAEVDKFMQGLRRGLTPEQAANEFARMFAAEQSDEYDYDKADADRTIFVTDLAKGIPDIYDTTRQWESDGDGVEAGEPLAPGKKFVGSFVPRLHPDAVLAGPRTGCCQRPGGQGEDSWDHSILSSNGGVFVVYNENGNIAAQSWVWRDKTGSFVFDNIEFHVGTKEKERHGYVIDVISKAAQDLAKETGRDVHMGTGFIAEDLIRHRKVWDVGASASRKRMGELYKEVARARLSEAIDALPSQGGGLYEDALKKFKETGDIGVVLSQWGDMLFSARHLPEEFKRLRDALAIAKKAHEYEDSDSYGNHAYRLPFVSPKNQLDYGVEDYTDAREQVLFAHGSGGPLGIPLADTTDHIPNLPKRGATIPDYVDREMKAKRRERQYQANAESHRRSDMVSEDWKGKRSLENALSYYLPDQYLHSHPDFDSADLVEKLRAIGPEARDIAERNPLLIQGDYLEFLQRGSSVAGDWEDALSTVEYIAGQRQIKAIDNELENLPDGEERDRLLEERQRFDEQAKERFIYGQEDFLNNPEEVVDAISKLLQNGLYHKRAQELVDKGYLASDLSLHLLAEKGRKKTGSPFSLAALDPAAQEAFKSLFEESGIKSIDTAHETLPFKEFVRYVGGGDGRATGLDGEQRKGGEPFSLGLNGYLRNRPDEVVDYILEEARDMLPSKEYESMREAVLKSLLRAVEWDKELRGRGQPGLFAPGTTDSVGTLKHFRESLGEKVKNLEDIYRDKMHETLRKVGLEPEEFDWAGGTSAAVAKRIADVIDTEFFGYNNLPLDEVDPLKNLYNFENNAKKDALALVLKKRLVEKRLPADGGWPAVLKDVVSNPAVHPDVKRAFPRFTDFLNESGKVDEAAIVKQADFMEEFIKQAPELAVEHAAFADIVGEFSPESLRDRESMRDWIAENLPVYKAKIEEEEKRLTEQGFNIPDDPDPGVRESLLKTRETLAVRNLRNKALQKSIINMVLFPWEGERKAALDKYNAPQGPDDGDTPLADWEKELLEAADMQQQAPGDLTRTTTQQAREAANAQAAQAAATGTGIDMPSADSPTTTPPSDGTTPLNTWVERPDPVTGATMTTMLDSRGTRIAITESNSCAIGKD